LVGERLAPWQIAEKSLLNMQEVQRLIAFFLQNGLVAKTSDGFSSYLEITKQGLDLLNRRWPKQLKATVLLVDDDQGVTASLKRGLESHGFAVDAFNDPEIALTNFKESKYDIAILDIRMPRMNGFELFRELRKMDGRTCFCFLTAFEIFEREFQRIFPDTSVKTFLKKPITAGELAKRLTEILVGREELCAAETRN
jgi:two-component system, OmpR family, response regulator ChvI